jgi:hypothetical protein
MTDTSMQACEQLNAWAGGFESILSKMTTGNFNWFLHTMLFLHTRYVIERQKEKQEKMDIEDDDDTSDDEQGIENEGGDNE